MTGRAAQAWITTAASPGVWVCRGRTPVGAFTLGQTKPTAAITGYAVLGYTAATLTDYYGDLTVNTDGSTVQGLRVHGAVYLAGNNITLQGCEIVGRAGAAYNGNYRGLVTNGGTNNVAQFNHLTQYDPSTNTDQSIYWREGIYLVSGSLTAYRNDIHDANHLAYITGGTLTAQGNYLHEPGFRNDDADHASDGTHPYWSHNDGIHLAGGSYHDIEGNNFVMKWSTLTGMNSAVNPDPAAEQSWPNCHGHLFRQANSTLPGVKVKNNWYAYGSAAVQWTGSTLSGGGGDWTVTGNRFTPNQGKEFSQYRQLYIDPTTAWGAINVDSSNIYSFDSDTPSGWRGQPLKAPVVSGTVKNWAYNSGVHTP